MEEYHLKLNISYNIDGKSKEIVVEISLDEIDNFNEFMNKILKKIDLKLSMRKFHLEIFYEDDWIKLIDLKSFYFFVSNNIHLEKDIKIRIAQTKNNDYELFDLDGTKYKNDFPDDSNRPTDKIYDRYSNTFKL